jgi:monoamine oxidase
MKKSDDALSQSKANSNNNSSSRLDKNDYYDTNNHMEQMYANANPYNSSNEQNSQLNGINNLKLNNEEGINNGNKSKEFPNDSSKAEYQNDIAAKTESDTNNKNQSASAAQNTSQSTNNTNSNMNIVHTHPWLSLNHEDISKYYRAELAHKLTSCLGVNEVCMHLGFLIIFFTSYFKTELV